MTKLTARDAFAGAIAVISLVGIIGLAFIERTIPDILLVTVSSSGAYFYRGVENGTRLSLPGMRSRSND